VIFGIIGSLLAIPLILFIGKVGIPATGDIATFFFSGTRLYLSLNFLHVFITLIGITLISVISVLYPVWKAMQISPVTAMQKNE
jgi:ABC-type lipoprotein release transport system permease subunit